MFFLEVLLVLKYKHGDVTAEFIQADIHEDDKVYIEISREFEQFSKNGRKKCLKLKKTLYGLRHIPHAFWYYMMNKLEQRGLK